MNVVLALSKEMAIFAVFAFLFSKSNLFRKYILNKIGLKEKFLLYLFFSSITVSGSYLGIQIQDAIANTRAIGAVTSGLLGGPILGFLVGLTGGIHRFFLGGFTNFSCALSTTIEGIIGGLFYLYFVKTGAEEKKFSYKYAFIATVISEAVQMIIIIFIAKPLSDAVSLVKVIAFPMIFFNSLGAAIFINILYDRKNLIDETGAEFAKTALNIAYKTIPVLSKGLTTESAQKLAEILKKETGVSTVYITDTKKLLAFNGLGADHHIVGSNISSNLTLECIEKKEVIFADGGEKKFQCPLDENCPLGTALIVPLTVEDEVVGAIGFFERKNVTFLNVNKSFGEGIGKILSIQLIKGKYEEQKRLLLESELKLIQAQINPHFLFNTLNTINAVIRINPEKAKELITNLSIFLRKNLKIQKENSVLADEIKHVETYLNIEKERFQERLNVEYDIDENILNTKVPTFTLQPLVENAVKYSISNIIENGKIYVRGFRDKNSVIIEIEDNGGFYSENISKMHSSGETGLGMNIVNKRIKNMHGEDSGLNVFCEPGVKTIVRLQINDSGVN
jgi:two-component system LytT family sensor kinase